MIFIIPGNYLTILNFKKHRWIDGDIFDFHISIKIRWDLPTGFFYFLTSTGRSAQNLVTSLLILVIITFLKN